MHKISQLFLQGLLAILPVAVTLAILYWLGTTAESTLGPLLSWLLPPGWYFPGLGIVAGVFVLTALGLLVNAYIVRELLALLQKPLVNIPLVKTLYRSVQDIARFAAPNRGEDELQRAVVVRLDQDLRLIGFITGKSMALGGAGDLTPVYLPLSYQIGGYTVLLPDSRIEPLDMGVQDAMRYVLTAGMARPQRAQD